MKNPKQDIASVFAILLGGIGVQHFYIGQVLRGVLDVLFCWTYIPAIVGFVEGLLWLTDDEESWKSRVARWNNEFE